MWKSALLHSLLSDSELSGIIFLSTLSSLLKKKVFLLFNLLIFHSLLNKLYIYTYRTKIYTYITKLSQRFVSQNVFLAGLSQKKSPCLFPQASHGQVKRLGSQRRASSSGQVVFALERLILKKKKSLKIPQERAMRGIYLKTLYQKLTARVGAIFTLSWRVALFPEPLPCRSIHGQRSGSFHKQK